MDSKKANDIVLAQEGRFRFWGFDIEPWLLKDLHEVSQALARYLDVSSYKASALLDPEFMSQAKLVRPMLFLLCAKLMDFRAKARIPVAVICEYIHVASLLHDDVVDDAVLRRGKPACHVVWDKGTSVLLGDYIYARACELIGEVESRYEVGGLLQVFARAIRMMSEGELMQLEVKGKFPTVEQYLGILERKTGALLAAATQAAWILGKDSQKAMSENLWQFGIYLGIAYQLLDDVLDYSSAGEASLGKPILQDLSEGKATLPLIWLRHNITDMEYQRLERILSGDFSCEDQQFVYALLQGSDTLVKTQNLAKSYMRKALDILQSAFPKSQDRFYLEKLMNALVQRKS